MKKIIFLTTFLLGIFAFSFASAGISLSVSPQKFDMTVLPGERQTGQIRLRNDSARPLPIRVNITPFDAEDGTGQINFREDKKLENWITFTEDNFVLRSGEDKRLRFEVKIPGDVNPGGYYLFASFQVGSLSQNKDDFGPEVIPAVGVPFLISTVDLNLGDGETVAEGPEVIDFSIEESSRSTFLENQLARFIAFGSDQSYFYVTKNMPGKFSVTVKNNDSYHIRPEGDLLVYKGDEKVAEGFLEGKTILPGKSRTFDIEIDGGAGEFASMGGYRAELDLRTNNFIRGEIISQKETLSFINISYYLWILLFLILVFFLIRKRIFLVLKFLFGKRISTA